MHEPFQITSLQNPRIKAALRLWDRRERDETGYFIIEGYREILRALEGNQPIATLFYCENFFLKDNEYRLLEECDKRDVELLSCTEKVFSKLSYRDRPDGLIAIAPIVSQGLQALPYKENSFYIVAVGIEKPGNLGTILRSADATRVDGVIICDQCTDPFNPNVVRASVGTLFTVPVIQASTEETLDWLKRNHISIVASTPHVETLYTQVAFNQSVAIVVGTEQYGLSAKWLESANYRVKIPMLGKADSLNVATATTLLLYEVLRQRL